LSVCSNLTIRTKTIMKMKFKVYLSIVFCAITSMIYAQDIEELQQMADADQQARMTDAINWTVLNKQDSLRRVRVLQLIKENKLKTAKDHLNAGIIFQHGNDTVASALAVKSFETALKLDPELNRWWYAAAVDRDLMRRGKPQVYGTQIIKDKTTNGKWARYNTDESRFTDEQRRYYGVETLKEQDEKIRRMNLIPLARLADRKPIDEVISAISSEFQKGLNSDFNVSEVEINNLGYEFVRENKDSEALKIFELNTKLYPDAWNTFDSLGEQQLKLGRKKEGLENYRKSLQLNPKNEQAQKILEKNNT